MKKSYEVLRMAKCGICGRFENQKEALELAVEMAKYYGERIVIRQLTYFRRNVVDVHTAVVSADGSWNRLN